MEFVAGILQALFLVLTVVLWLVPIAIAIWVLVKLAELSHNVDAVRRQLTVMAEQTGAPVIPPPPVKHRRPRSRLWAFAALLLAAVLVMAALLATTPGTSWRLEQSELEQVGGNGSGTATRPLRRPPPPIEEAPSP